MTASGRRFLLLLGAFFFRYRNALFPVVFLALALTSRPIARPAASRWDLALDVLGILLVALGQALRALVIGLAYIRRGGLDKKVHADRLVRSGIFAHSRNPLYLGNFLCLVGFSLIHDSWRCYLVGIPFFALAYLAIVLAEEDFLGRKFGAEYEEYRQEVPRFRLRLRGLATTIGERELDWRRVVRKEYGSTFSGLTFILFLLVWDRYQEEGWAAVRPLSGAALAIWGVGLVLYLLARWLKKTRRLGTRHAEAGAWSTADR